MNPISQWLEVRKRRSEVELAELEARHKMVGQLQEATNLITERPETGGWYRAGYWDNKLNPAERVSMVRQARVMFRFDPNARAVLANMLYYIIGEGVKITPQSKDIRLHKLWREFWTAPRNKMALKQTEIILRTLRDGEVLLQFYQGVDDQNNATWKTTVRFRDPDRLQTPPLEYGGPAARADQGILMDPNDNEKPLKYFFRQGYDDNFKGFDVIDAEEIMHIKLFADSEQKRGESYIQPVMEMFGQYKEWLRYRIILNKVRTAFVMIRKVGGGGSDVERIKDTIAQSPTARGGETNKKRVPPPGTVLNANNGVDYDFKSANINAGDAAEDGRSMKLGMAAGTITPEYVFGDASNANYASTLIAEAPFVKGIKFWQKFFEFHLQEIYRRVVQGAVDSGKLVAPPEEDIFAEPGKKPLGEATDPIKKAGTAAGGMDATDPQGEVDKGEKKLAGTESLTQVSEAEAFWMCDVQWPEVVHREIDKTTQATIAQMQAGLISDATAAAVLGFDYDEEVRKQQQVEENAADNPFKKNANGGVDPNAPDEGDMDAELQDVMGSLTPEESHGILQSSDPKQVMAMVKQARGRKAVAKKQPAAQGA